MRISAVPFWHLPGRASGRKSSYPPLCRSSTACPDDPRTLPFAFALDQLALYIPSVARLDSVNSWGRDCILLLLDIFFRGCHLLLHLHRCRRGLDEHRNGIAEFMIPIEIKGTRHHSRAGSTASTSRSVAVSDSATKSTLPIFLPPTMVAMESTVKDLLCDRRVSVPKPVTNWN